jgi:hypothetical protein
MKRPLVASIRALGWLLLGSLISAADFSGRIRLGAR